MKCRKTNSLHANSVSGVTTCLIIHGRSVMFHYDESGLPTFGFYESGMPYPLMAFAGDDSCVERIACAVGISESDMADILRKMRIAYTIGVANCDHQDMIRWAARKRLWQLRLESAIITVNKAVATAAAFLF